MSGKKISGICVVITNPDGAVVASAVDCDRSGYGGFSLSEAQTIRARDRAKADFLHTHLNGRLAKGASGYFIAQFWENAQRAGYKMQEIEVGKDD